MTGGGPLSAVGCDSGRMDGVVLTEPQKCSLHTIQPRAGTSFRSASE